MTRPIDISPEDLETVRRILRDHVPDCEVLAFGSRVKGKARQFSDLDLAIAGKGPVDASLLAQIRDAFSESYLPFKVDVLDWYSASENFKQAVGDVFALVQPVDDRD